MKISIRVSTLEESNLFLRALWARLRARFGAVSWQYTPKRDRTHRLISFGYVQLGGRNQIQVDVHYLHGGVIDGILFSPMPSDPQSWQNDLDSPLKECVDLASKEFRSPTRHSLERRVISRPSLAVGRYDSTRLSFFPLADGSTRLVLHVDAFDEADAEHEFRIRAENLLDFLSTWTNCTFWLAATKPDIAGTDGGEPNMFFEDDDWIDDQPVSKNFLRLSRQQLAFADKVISEDIRSDDILLRASHLFHDALEIYYAAYPDRSDLVTAILISALEVASLDKQSELKSCPSCGQPMYKISRRVIELGKEILGFNMGKFFKEQYGRRSRYLHEGVLFGKQPNTRNLQPLLDPSEPEGFVMWRGAGRLNVLVEFTSFILRRKLAAVMGMKK